MPRKYRLAALGLALVLLVPGCAARRIRLALQQRTAHVFADAPPPSGVGNFQAGLGVMIPAVQAMAEEALVEHGPGLAEGLGDLSAPGMENVALDLRWDGATVELRPAPPLGHSGVYLLLAVPGTVTADTPLVSLENRLRLSARLPLALQARVVEDRGLEVLAQLVDPDELLLALSLEGMPPGADGALSAALQARMRDDLREFPPDPIPLFATDDLFPESLHIPLAEATVLAFPGGRPTVFVGLQTSLPVDQVPGVDPVAMMPEEGDWVAQVDGDVIAAVLARAGLSGDLGVGIVSDPDRLDISDLALTDEGFRALVRVWRLKPPPMTVDLEATGSLGWNTDRLVLEIRTLERPDKGEVAARRLPLSLESAPVELPWPVDRLETVEGGIRVEGRME